MSKVSRAILGLVLAAASLPATTLEPLSLDEMAVKSTGIVKARVTVSRSAYRGGSIYTYYQLEVAETWKGTPAARMEVAVPGGVAGGIRQTVVGAPTLSTGQDYVLFLWAGRSGLIQVIGLSQGVFQVSGAGTGDAKLTRSDPGTAEQGMEEAGRLSELRSRVRRALAKEGDQQ